VCGREQHGTDSSVRINDVFFAGHAFCLSALTLCQCVLFERGTQRVHEHTRLAFAIVLPLTVTYAAAAWLFPADISVISCALPATGAACARPLEDQACMLRAAAAGGTLAAVCTP